MHRLDRDSSGILVMGRTQLSTTVLHSVFREKTVGAFNDVTLSPHLFTDCLFCILSAFQRNRYFLQVLGSKNILQKRYLALVIGSPRRRQGSISVPLMKVKFTFRHLTSPPISNLQIFIWFLVKVFKCSCNLLLNHNILYRADINIS